VRPIDRSVARPLTFGAEALSEKPLNRDPHPRTHMEMKPVERCRPMSCRLWIGVLSGCVMLSAGCPSAERQAGPDGASTRLAGVTLRLLIVDDAQLAKAIRQRAGDWEAQTGSTFEVIEKPTAAFLAGEHRAADAVFYPAYLLGPLAEMEAIRPVSRVLLADPKLNWHDVFNAVRLHETMWGQQVYALPLGSPVMQCYCRADLLSLTGRQPPSTWKEYQELAELWNRPEYLPDGFFGDETPWYPTAEPLAPGWAGLTLLARAAAYAKHPDHYSTLFDIDSMQPRIASAPFVKALEELAAAARLGPPQARQFTPVDVRQLFHRGQCGLALTWPSAAGMADSEINGAAAPVVLAELPGSSEVYDPQAEAWKTAEGEIVRHIPLLSETGRLGSATKSSTHPDAAEELLAWLIGAEWRWGTGIAALSPNTTMFRGAHVADAEDWFEPMDGENALSTAAETIQQSLSRRESMPALRIAGRERYLAALDAAVYQVLEDDVHPRDALEAAADKWQAINDDLGVATQRRAYRRSLGLVR